LNTTNVIYKLELVPVGQEDSEGLLPKSK